MGNKMIHTPEGVRDIYGKEFLRKSCIKEKLHESLSLYGFQDIETPSFEFSDVYSNDVGTTPEKEMYRFFDKEGNMLVLRPDFTPSIARSASKYFLEDDMPVRLCYEGNVFNNTHDLQGKLKESTQMGAELIGDVTDPCIDGEMLCLVVESLLNVGFTDFQVCIGNVEYFKGICDKAGFDEDMIEELRTYISSKNYFGARELLVNNNADDNVIKALLDVSTLTELSSLDKARAMVKNERSLDALSYLEKVYDYVCMYGYEKYVSLDLCMLSKFHYYTGLIFKAYTYGTGDAIVKGGRYDNLLGKFGKNASAVGFVFLVDDIMSALTMQHLIKDTETDITWVVYPEGKRQEATNRIKELRGQGKSCAPIIKADDKTEDDYKKLAADRYIKNVEFI